MIELEDDILSEIVNLSISGLVVGKFNVRKRTGDVDELADSIEQVGILEPLIVRPIGKKFEVVAGTRRLAAAQRIKLKVVPCIVKEMDDDTAMIVSLAENIQRGDLNDEEIVESYLVLRARDPKKWTQGEFARRLGKSGTWLGSSIAAYESLQKLRESGLDVSMKTNPEPDERANGTIPVAHLHEVEKTIRSKEIHEAYPIEADRDRKRVELVKAVRDMPRADARTLVERFRKNPERSIESMKSQYMARTTGVRIDKTYLSPGVAQKLDDLAESRHTTMEDVLPEIVERGLSTEQATLEDYDDEIESEVESITRMEVPYSEQYHQQRVWNLNQLKDTPFDVLTVGFSQKSIEHLIEELSIAGIKLLIDVRKNPLSQYRPEFNKENLMSVLKDSGIRYEHIEQLGVTRELRDRLYSKQITYQEFFDIYDKEILTEKWIHHLTKQIDGNGPIALLCTEISPTLCHRNRIAEVLTKEGKLCYDL
jgi:ParB/RepB/Spo0J family partition protein